ncbi:hypothetical protein [Afifella pfennigii]|uniref:hypothetical protein n=1 Tax=Afifella pfennigii TaxID=209897 RepID=UPI000479AE4A|nr:hypothetical protein [Afifella pfennigii]
MPTAIRFLPLALTLLPGLALAQEDPTKGVRQILPMSPSTQTEQPLAPSSGAEPAQQPASPPAPSAAETPSAPEPQSMPEPAPRQEAAPAPEPAPTQPTEAQPTETQPAPTQPAPTQPAPTQPADAQPAPSAEPPGAAAMTETPADYAWRMSRTETGASAFIAGCDECDDVPLSVTCTISGNDVTIRPALGVEGANQGDLVEVAFEIDRDIFRRDGRLAYSELDAAFLPEITVEPSDPMLYALALGNDLTVSMGQQRARLTLKGSAAALRSMRAACEAPAPSTAPVGPSAPLQPIQPIQPPGGILIVPPPPGSGG